jgi:hypothetical protein
MTDEEFGRAWAKQQGIEPTKFPPFDDDSPFWKWPYMPGVGHIPDAKSESESFMRLGRAVRDIHKLVPPLKKA